MNPSAVLNAYCRSACVLILCAASFGAGRFAKLPELNVPHPFCQGESNLKVGPTYFVEIANQLAGREEYNQLIKLYRKKSWEKFSEELSKFRKLFENSPLQEAASFLEVQVAFDRAETGDVKPQEAERMMREVLLLYPKSTLAPILSASAAGFWIKTGHSTKALSLYEVLKKEYPFHELSCVFQFGAAEANYQSGDRETAERIFVQILQKCDNQRIRVGAEMRLIDLKMTDKNIVQSRQLYEKLYETNGMVIAHYYPMMLYNLGELKFRDRRFPSSKFFFNEYLRYKSRSEDCEAYALKRLADITLFTKKDLSEAVGDYLAVRERVPKSEVSAFSYIHALLLELKDVDEAEQERRLKIIDQEIDKVKSERLRSLAFLEKGLAMLEAGEKTALDYLVRLNERTQFNLNKGGIADFVREELLSILEEKVEGVTTQRVRREAEKDLQMFGPLEAAYPVWLKGTAHESRAKDFYAKLILRRFKETLARGDLNGGLEKLDRWKKSPLWEEKPLDPRTQVAIGVPLSKYLSEVKDEKAKSAAQTLSNKEELLTAFLVPNFAPVIGTAIRQTGDKAKLAKFYEGHSRQRTIASSSKLKIPDEIRGFLAHQTGLNLWALQKTKEADLAFKDVKSEPFMTLATQDRLRLYLETQRYKEMIDLGFGSIPNFPEKDRVTYAVLALEGAQKGKLWKTSDKLLGMVKKLEIDDKTLASFYAFSGRSAYELKNCGRSITNYGNAFRLNAELPGKFEDKFYLGKCFVKERRLIEARKAWEEVASSSDKFWGPLAQNELRILEIK